VTGVGRIIILNGFFARAEKYQSTGRGVNQRSQWLPMREAAREEEPYWPMLARTATLWGCKGRGGLLRYSFTTQVLWVVWKEPGSSKEPGSFSLLKRAILGWNDPVC
jgi:hypothetical protein